MFLFEFLFLFTGVREGIDGRREGKGMEEKGDGG